jgi:hypothetical protein
MPHAVFSRAENQLLEPAQQFVFDNVMHPSGGGR